MKNNKVETVDEFKFLGITFTKNKHFAIAKKHAAEQARKALSNFIGKSGI